VDVAIPPGIMTTEPPPTRRRSCGGCDPSAQL